MVGGGSRTGVRWCWTDYKRRVGSHAGRNAASRRRRNRARRDATDESGVGEEVSTCSVSSGLDRFSVACGAVVGRTGCQPVLPTTPEGPSEPYTRLKLDLIPAHQEKRTRLNWRYSNVFYREQQSYRSAMVRPHQRTPRRGDMRDDRPNLDDARRAARAALRRRGGPRTLSNHRARLPDLED